MKTLLLSSLVFVFLIGILCLPSASALPVSYNTTSINLGLTSVPRNSSSYDVFPLIPDNWLWEKFDNNTIDSSSLGVTGTITYNTNLIRLYSFESNLVNSVTGSVNGTVTGTTTYTGGHEGQGFSFNGASYIKIGNISALSFSKTNPFSISTWIKASSSSDMELVTKYQDFSSAGYSLRMFTGGTILFRITDNSNTWEISAGSGYNDGIWHHIVATYDGSSNQNGMKIYVDGVLKVTGTSASTMGTITNSASVTFGALGIGTSLYTGIMDETRLYNTNLSQAQVSALYMVGHYSQSHTFDGREYVSLGNTLGFERTNPFSFSSWVKYTSVGTGGFGTIISKIAGAGNTGYVFNVNGAGNLKLYVINTQASNALIMHSTTTTNDGIWHYVVVTYDGSSSPSGVKFYIDGNLDTSTIEQNNLSASILNGGNLEIGNDAAFTDNFVGQLDNVKIYPYALSSSQITSDYNSISPISSGKQFMSYYNGISGSSTMTNKLGFGPSTVTLNCALSSSTAPFVESGGANIYHACTTSLNHVGIINGTLKHDFSVTACNAVGRTFYPFITIKQPTIWCLTTNTVSTNTYASSSGGNQSFTSSSGAAPVKLYSNQEIATTDNNQIVLDIFKYNYNNTSLQTAPLTSTACNINYKPNNTTKFVDSIVCDPAIPANAIRYWNGMLIQGVGNYATNSTQLFLNSIDASAYKKLLTLPCALYGAEAPCITFILTDQTQTDWLVVLTSTHVYYGNAQTALGKLNNNNYGFQSYDIITQGTSSSYEIQNPILQSLKLYGPINLNLTVSKAGLFTLPSGYTVKTTSIESAIRTIDPQWTNDATDIPIITSTSSLFPIFLTVSNAPVFSAIKVTNPYQLINSEEAVWAVAQLDSTRTVEFDLPSNVCVNVYVADISVSPSIWNFQGIICASGVNQKTISYTNTLPFTFWTYPWGASDSFTPNTNGLVTTVRHTTAPFSYNIVLKNSTGNVFQNTTYTSNSTIDTQNFNLTGRAKPVSLYISSVTGGVNQIYSAFLGSPISLASTASFFNQYFSYQGFNLLAFIPIIFASMFTRNTIGIGVVLTVLCIATLSWLSVVVIPELDIMIMIVIAIIGLIAYRLTYY